MDPTYDPESAGAVRGQVIDVDSGIVLANATIAILAAGLVTETNVGGFYALSNVQPGMHLLTATKVGYYAHEESISVVAGEERVKNIELSPLPIPISKDAYVGRPQPANGMWRCAIGTPAYAGDPCSAGSLAGGGLRNTVQVPKDPGENVTGYLLSVRWQPNSGLSGNGIVQVNIPVDTTNVTQDEGIYRSMVSCVIKCQIDDVSTRGGPVKIHGENQLLVHVQNQNQSNVFESAIVHKLPDRFMNFTVALYGGTATSPDTWGGVAYEQPFEVQVVWLYWNARPDSTDLYAFTWGE